MPFPAGSGAADPPARTAAESACAPGRDVFQYDCYDSMNPVLLQEKQETTILLQLHVSIQQSGEQLLYRSPLFVLILSAVYPFAAGWISDFSGWFCEAIRFFLFRSHFFCFLLTMPRQWSRMVLQKRIAKEDRKSVV